jgi:hypothetical protein
MLLQQGRREVEAVVAQQQKLGLVTKEQVENTRKFDSALYDASRAYQSFYRELAMPLLPGITTALNYAIEHKDAVADAFKVMSIGLAALGFWVLKISGPIGVVAAAFTAIAGAYGLVKEDIQFLLDPKKESLAERAYGIDPMNPNATKQQKKDYAQSTGLASLFLDPWSQLALRSGGFQSAKPDVNINTINVNTQATDANGIGAAIGDSLQWQLGQLISQTDNGVHA